MPTKRQSMSRNVQGSANKWGAASTIGHNVYLMRFAAARSSTNVTRNLPVFAAAVILAWVVTQVIEEEEEAFGQFGYSVALTDAYAIVGDINAAAGKGNARIYKRTGSSWGNSVEVTGDSVSDLFGSSVSIDGDYAIVGDQAGGTDDSGNAFIYERSGSSWNNVVELSGSNFSGNQPKEFGASVDIAGRYAIVGDITGRMDHTGTDDSGNAFIYWRDNDGNWNSPSNTKELSGNQHSNQFGYSVAMTENYAIVGDLGGQGGLGEVWIFKNDGVGGWGNKVNYGSPDLVGDKFGSSVGITDNYAIVGDYGGGSGDGIAWIIKRTGTNIWDTATAVELNGDSNLNYQFGYSVAITDNYAIVGDQGGGNRGTADGSGGVWIFTKEGDTWNTTGKQFKGIDLGPGQNTRYHDFGESVAITNNYAIVGDPDGATHGVGNVTFLQYK